MAGCTVAGRKGGRVGTTHRGCVAGESCVPRAPSRGVLSTQPLRAQGRKARTGEPGEGDLYVVPGEGAVPRLCGENPRAARHLGRDERTRTQAVHRQNVELNSAVT